MASSSLSKAIRPCTGSRRIDRVSWVLGGWAPRPSGAGSAAIAARSAFGNIAVGPVREASRAERAPFRAGSMVARVDARDALDEGHFRVGRGARRC